MNKYTAVREMRSWKVLVLLLPAFVVSFYCHGQVKPQAAASQAPTNIRILEEHKDAKGNTVRTIQYDQGIRKMTETLVIPAVTNVNARYPINPDTLNKDSVIIVVNKAKYNVQVYYRRKLVRYYQAVFGPKPLENKRMEGDRCTPEGWFTIKNKNPNSKYTKFLLLSYPNDSCTICFNRAKQNGNIPKTARIGSDVGIHGIWKGGDDMIEKGVGWTDGCVALKNKDIEELYTLTGIGTKVFIRK